MIRRGDRAPRRYSVKGKIMPVYERRVHSEIRRRLDVGDYSGDGRWIAADIACPFCSTPMRECVNRPEPLHRIVQVLERHPNGDVTAFVHPIPRKQRVFGCKSCYVAFTLPPKAR